MRTLLTNYLCLFGVLFLPQVPPWMKLPAFYVLDAISKNVFEPYAAKFSAFVVPLFLDTFSQVDHSTRSKMEEMLVTWRTGAPSGKELFGVATQVSLERQIWGNDSSSAVDNVRTRSLNTLIYKANYYFLVFPTTGSFRASNKISGFSRA